MKISVTKEQIQNSRRGSREGCPVAIALEESTGRSWLVDDCLIIDRFSGMSYETPEPVKEFLYGFDAGNEMEPFDFEIWIYD